MIVVTLGIGALLVKRANWHKGGISYSAYFHVRIAEDLFCQYAFQQIGGSTITGLWVRLNQCQSTAPGHLPNLQFLQK